MRKLVLVSMALASIPMCSFAQEMKCIDDVIYSISRDGEIIKTNAGYIIDVGPDRYNTQLWLDMQKIIICSTSRQDMVRIINTDTASTITKAYGRVLRSR